MRVWHMHQQGYKQQEITDALGLSQCGVSYIIKRAQEGGEEALQRKKAPGAKPRLDPEQKEELLAKLEQGAEAFGFEGDVWTAKRIAQMIRKEFGISYHHDYIGPLLRGLGWSFQKPVVRATQRDEEAIATGVKNAGPSSKNPKNEDYTIIFIDESGFYLLPGLVRTWAPVGQTPILRCKLTRDHYSAISGITLKGELFLSMQRKAFDSQDIITFLKELMAQIPGKLLIIWDGASIHRSKLLKQFLAEGAAKTTQLERLPPYAPELNPDEGVWHYLKHVELGNVTARNLDDLGEKLTAAYQRLASKPEIIKACFAQAGLYQSSA